ncbi:MAG: hypothetical protein QOJ94_2512, partial [Sphingomonadales bacterium]|nr:hypothetical protein [Sphingomonadales bacterium]
MPLATPIRTSLLLIAAFLLTGAT